MTTHKNQKPEQITKSDEKIASSASKKCFVMMPISDNQSYESGHFSRVYEYLLKPAIVEAGYDAIRADDTVKTDYIVVGIVKQIIDADLVICDMSSRNPNVMYALGIRHAFNKPVVLIKDKMTDKIFDIQGLRYTEYDSSLRVDTVKKDIDKIKESIKETMSDNGESINSIVHLAQIKSAPLPDTKDISPDTSVLLKAILELGQRLGSRDNLISKYYKNSKDEISNFKTRNVKIYLNDGSSADIGDPVYDGDSKTILGIYQGFNDDEMAVLLSEENGRTRKIFLTSPQGRNLTTTPF